MAATDRIAPLTDADLLRRFRGGDDGAFALLVQRHAPLVHRICLRVAGSDADAEDASQAVFWLLARHAPRIDPARPLGAWLQVVATRTAANLRRGEQRRRRHEGHPMASPAAPSSGSDGFAGALHEHLAALSEKDRSALILHHFEARSHDEAATVLGVRPDAFRQILHRAHERLRQRLVRAGFAATALTVASALASECTAATPPPLWATSFARDSGWIHQPLPAHLQSSIHQTLPGSLSMTAKIACVATVLATLAVPVWSLLRAADPPPAAPPATWTEGVVNADILRPVIIGTAEVKKSGDYNYIRSIVSQPSIVQEGPLRPITIIAPRGGHGSGQVVVQSSASQKGLTATMSGLSGSAGSIPASSIRVRYAAAKPPDQMNSINMQSPQRPYYTDLVSDVPDAPVVPIWVTVAVPADTAAGTYQGSLTVKPAGAAKATEVAVVVEVAPWICPPPRNWTAHMGLVSVPDGTAYYYKVKHFSDQHFALMEKSFALMGEIGCDTLWIPTVEDPMTGSRFSMVRCAKRDGRLVADLSLVEKYLDSYLRHNGPPEVCYLYVQNGHQIGHAYPTDLQPIGKRAPPGPVRVTSMDGSESQKFVYGTPEAEDFFKQVLDGMYAIYAKRGLDTDALMLGTSSEKRTSNAVCTFFKKIGPKWRWVAQEHDTPLELSGVAVGYNCPARTSPISFKGYPWQNPCISGASAQQPTLFGHPAYWRMRCEHWMDIKRTRGISRVGVDMWLVNDGQKSFLPEHWSGGQEVMRICWGMTCMVAPGPDGAIPTTHLEWTREGMQELEARIQIEKAIVAKLLSPEQEAAARNLLENRSRTFKAGPHPTPWDWGGFQCWDWQKLTRGLYQLAASLPAPRP